MSKERNLNYRNSDSKGNKAKRIGWGKRKEDTILREGVSLQCCFPFTGNRRRIWEAVRREWSFKRLCCWSSKEIQKCGGNKRGRWRKTSPLLFQSWNLCVVNTSNRMTKTKKTNRINLFSGFINQDKIENLLSRRTAVNFAQMRNARARRANVQFYID